ncbi:MAG: hypothetical protein IT373_09995 [Polyangiaceae bacterium]|nr:hypothetical protein [Polyangiaceae bacterium]
MVRRKLTIALLALTSVSGFAWGFASLGHCAASRRQHFEEKVRDICLDAARQAVRAESAGPVAP